MTNETLPEKKGIFAISPEAFEEHMDALENQNDLESGNSLFLMRKASVWLQEAQHRPTPKMLFGELWFETELCILFADTNLGKSILAVQIGDSISNGNPIKGFQMEAGKQPVLYFDFELTDKQFENRYSDHFAGHHPFDDNFLRAEIDPDAMAGDLTFEEYLNLSLEQAVISTQARVLIIDNITYLKNETEKARDALPLMKQLKALKSKYGLSILALAHTPKRDLSKPITRNDLQGSKMLINFCDSSFAIGESMMDKSYRYLKQIKARNCEIMYDTSNVGVFEIIKPTNYLHFNFIGFAHEREHLKAQTLEEQNELEVKIMEILEKTPDASGLSIAKALCPEGHKLMSFNVKISRMIKRLRAKQS